MNRLVLVTGFANPESSAERVAAELACHFNYDDFDYLTLGDALIDPVSLNQITKNADVFTHSAGFIALQGSHPAAIHAFNAPFASSRRRLAVQTYLRHRNEADLRETNDPLRIDTGFAREALAHPIKHLGPFLRGAISSCSPLALAIGARDAGIAVGLAYTDRDCYSHPTDTHLLEFRARGVKVAQILGVHDELILRPAKTAYQYFTHRH
ncbi:MAG TPA: hypothetical protein VLG47_08255 [Candidatus Saccharimonadales bacterium]|nr:hypothetical protein [Candidatus Saccharimonadales bacterium]